MKKTKELIVAAQAMADAIKEGLGNDAGFVFILVPIPFEGVYHTFGDLDHRSTIKALDGVKSRLENMKLSQS